jgi:hypothetical protein
MFTEKDRLNPPIPGVWIEQLRHMGVLKVLKEEDDRTILEIEYPGSTHSINTRIWAEQESERMKSFGINAAAAPQWSGYSEL